MRSIPPTVFTYLAMMSSALCAESDVVSRVNPASLNMTVRMGASVEGADDESIRGLEHILGGQDAPDVSTTARHGARLHPEAVDDAVVRRGRARRRDGMAHRRQRAQVHDQRADVLLIPVRRVIPGHSLPMERPAVAAHAGPDGARDLGIAPSADAGRSEENTSELQ